MPIFGDRRFLLAERDKIRFRRWYVLAGAIGLFLLFALVWWFGTLVPWWNAYRLVAKGVETQGIVTKSLRYKNLKTGEPRWNFTIVYDGYAADNTSIAQAIAVGAKLPVIYLPQHPNVVAIGRRDESPDVLATRNIGYSPVANSVAYGLIMLLALVVPLAALQRPT
jgi:hypothetical protein